MTKQDLIHKANVIYVRSGKKIIGGMNTGRDAIEVHVTEKVPLSALAKTDRIPKRIHGRETDVIGKTHKIYALRTGRYRPMLGGVSGGHPNITAGTLNPFKPTGIMYILSNKHVGAPDGANIGDEWWQPGKADGGTSVDSIGYLSDFVPITYIDDESLCPIANFIVDRLNAVAKFFRCQTRIPHPILDVTNLVDCAIARPFKDEDVSEEILEIGIPTGFAEAIVNEMIRKSGRTTGLTENIVTATDGMVNVGYGDGKIAVFTDQIMTNAMAEGGDSGSLGINKDNKVVALLFAGSDQVTIFNKISNVLEQLELGGINE